MLGDPDKATSIDIIKTLVEQGADALELGIPYSDPIADGPTIQKASIRALGNKIRPDDCFDIIKTVRDTSKCANWSAAVLKSRAGTRH